MNISSTSSSGSSSALWALLAQRAASATRSSQTGSSDNQHFNVQTATPTAATSNAASAVRASFDTSTRSTASFAQAGGMGPPPDPIASLDSDGSGSVSADEFGLKSASSDVQKLFKAIDGDGDGALSSDELQSFRDKMMQADPPPGPPPDQGSAAAGAGGKPDVSAFIERLAARYAELSGSAGFGNSNNTSSTTTVSLSA